jgi:Flp pilus assembly pilin Flp
VNLVRGAREKGCQLCSLFSNFIEEESGVTSIEYAMIAVLIAIVIVSTVEVDPKRGTAGASS